MDDGIPVKSFVDALKGTESLLSLIAVVLIAHNNGTMEVFHYCPGNTRHGPGHKAPTSALLSTFPNPDHCEFLELLIFKFSVRFVRHETCSTTLHSNNTAPLALLDMALVVLGTEAECYLRQSILFAQTVGWILWSEAFRCLLVGQPNRSPGN